MGVDVNALIPVYLRASFVRKSDVEEYIDDLKDDINRAKDRLKKFAFMTEPKKFCSEHQDVDLWLDSETEEHLETIETCSWKLYVAEKILENWDIMHHENGCTYSIKDLGVENFEDLARMSTDYCAECHTDGSPVYYEDDIDKSLYEQTINTKLGNVKSCYIR